MGNKRNKQISVFIILFLFVLGMYLDTFKVHSAFLYAVGDMDSSCIASVASGFADTHVCTAGMLSSRGDRSREQITFRLSLLRREKDRIFCLRTPYARRRTAFVRFLRRYSPFLRTSRNLSLITFTILTEKNESHKIPI